VVLDVSATIVVAHSEKENASATFTKTFGFHPLGVWCDNTTDFLAGMLRTGKAGSNTAADHMEVLGQAIAQVPAAQRKHLLIRSDGAGASHDLVDWLTALPRTRWQKYWWPSARRPTTWAAPSPLRYATLGPARVSAPTIPPPARTDHDRRLGGGGGAAASAIHEHGR